MFQTEIEINRQHLQIAVLNVLLWKWDIGIILWCKALIFE